MNSYLFYTKLNREKIKKENPDLKSSDVVKEMGKRWKNISDDDKAPYEKMAKEDKARYDKEKAEYDKK